MILDQLQSAIADRYKVERELGRGGMATVFLATDARHERQVAIKVLHPDLAATIGAERFEREIKLAAKLQHPHILGLIDSGAANGLFYYVMPFIQGESVRDKLDREKQLSVDEALQITLEVADALGYAHAQSIIHRDIKPENVMMSNGHALVADFGIARARTEAGQNKLTQTGMAVGTPVYMSPEQATGEAVGPSADIYSLGCMLYEMLAGEPPFQGPNAMAIMARHAMEAVPSIRIIRPAVPEEVEEAILAAMEKHVADRPRTAADFCEILGTHLGATATRRVTTRHTAARRIPSDPRLAATAAPLWRRPWAIPAAIGMVGAISLGVWTLAAGESSSRSVTADPEAKKVAVLYFADESDGELKPVADRLTEALIRDLDRIPDLTVVSKNGVAPFRDRGVSADSIARALKVGTLVVGSVSPEGPDQVSVSLKLLDRNGTDIGQRRSVHIARDSLFAVEESVAGRVAELLRLLIGTEMRLREGLAGTRVMAAWTSYNRAENARKEAQRLARANRDSSAALLVLADSLLRDAEAADGKWMEPKLLRGEVALSQSRLAAAQPAERSRLLDVALARADTALATDASNARALALRGTVAFAKWRDDATITDQRVRRSYLTAAQKDLEDAVLKDPSLASALATLTFVYYDLKDVYTSLRRAEEAYNADAFLSNTSDILGRLFWGSYDTSQFAQAAKWCAEGERRFPANQFFTSCRLWMMLAPDETPDIAAAWQLAARVDSLAPSNRFASHLARMLVGGVIGKAGKAAAGPAQAALIDSADKVLQAARGDRTVDPEQALPGYEAVMRTQMGDHQTAIGLLTRYVQANPDHSFQVGGNVHWWWTDIRRDPGFARLMSRAP